MKFWFLKTRKQNKRKKRIKNAIQSNDYCVVCDCYIPEGTMVCKYCMKKRDDIVYQELLDKTKDNKSEE